LNKAYLNKHYNNILMIIFDKTKHIIYLTYEQKLANKSLFDV